ncbi:MAG: hypothetical protein Q8922_07340 [Bacteroidota bacterium]|nr:hypothetical protein [Bacteroidota bacterium]MDP4233549.1 hypothetical protein [Bacteroidota bacterium]MDP4243676.1 hypothetical protein [Bacteroidota bacterium]MDP4287735.1 hypothetical protein [Bacteroidota bacterium]
MPSKAAQIIAYLSVLVVSVLLHRFVYANLRRVLLRDYPKSGQKLTRLSRILFVVMDSPFLYLYFRGMMPQHVVVATTWLLYPFAVWQSIMLLWAAILMPFAMWRRTGAFGLLRLREKVRIDREGGEVDVVNYDSSLEVVTE